MQQELLSASPTISYWARRLAPRNHFDREDLIGEGWLAVVKVAPKYQPAQGVLFQTFVEKRVRGAMIDSIRRRNGRSGQRTTCHISNAFHVSAASTFHLTDSAIRVERILSGLSIRQRKILRLRYFNEWTSKQIGLVLGISESRVRQIYAGIMRKLRTPEE